MFIKLQCPSCDMNCTVKNYAFTLANPLARVGNTSVEKYEE